MKRSIFTWNGKPIPRHVWILLAIVAVGFFVRAYHYHDWLRFSPDEARDATYIVDALTGKAPLPDLGPQAGNTRFYLGPLYYQVLYVSALLFGTAPEAFAYPDLLFSILVIPLLYVYLRKLFSLEISLFLTAVLALSSFVIETARFSSNPNSIPFFLVLFLLGLLGVMERGESVRKRWWAAAIGIGLGVGIQLHTLLFLIMPAIAAIVAVYLWIRKNLSWKDLVIALACFAIVNAGQLTYEWRTGGSNIRHLFKGAQSESNIGSETLAGNVAMIAACQVQANIRIVANPVDFEKCGGLFNIAKVVERRNFIPGSGWFVNGIAFAFVMVLSVLFSVGGYLLAWRQLKDDPDEGKRNFIGLFLVFNLIALLAMMPVSSQIAVHYFNVLVFVPFILLGLWMNLSLERKWLPGKKSILIFMMIFCMMDTSSLLQMAHLYEDKVVSDSDNSILGEITPMLDYLVAGSGQPDRVYVTGSDSALKRFYAPLVYLAWQSDIRMIRPGKREPFAPGTRFFYIDDTKSADVTLRKTIDGDTVLSVRRFGKIVIFTMMKNPL